MGSVLSWPPEYWRQGLGGFDYILWVLIVADPARSWFHFIWGRRCSASPPLLGHLGRRARLSADLHPRRTVRDTSQVHPPLGWYGAQLTSTCPHGPGLSLHPLASGSGPRLLNVPDAALLTRFNKTAPSFTNKDGRPRGYSHAGPFSK